VGSLCSTNAGSRTLDAALAFALACTACVLSAVSFSFFDEAMYEHRNFNIWFQADLPRFILNIIEGWGAGEHTRTSVHPAFSILFYPLTSLLTVAGIDPLGAARLLVVCAAGGSAAFFYMALRNLELTPTAAGAFTAAFIASAGSLFWFSVVETYPFATLSVVFMFWVLTRPAAPNRLLWILASAGTLAVTITNWSMGLAAAFFRLRFAEFIRVSVAAFALVAVLAVGQKVMFPDAGLFFNPRSILAERWFTQFYVPETQKDAQQTAWTPLVNVQVMLLHSVVTPTPVREVVAEWRMASMAVTNQTPGLRDHGLLGAVGAALWAVMLGLGVWGCCKARRRDAATAIGAFAAGQIALHLVYGTTTFLYAAHYVPALVAIAAFGALTPARHVAVAAAFGFTILAGANNWSAFTTAAELANTIANVIRP
jgi:uncharacterized protein YcfJ